MFQNPASEAKLLGRPLAKLVGFDQLSPHLCTYAGLLKVYVSTVVTNMDCLTKSVYRSWLQSS